MQPQDQRDKQPSTLRDYLMRTEKVEILNKEEMIALAQEVDKLKESPGNADFVEGQRIQENASPIFKGSSAVEEVEAVYDLLKPNMAELYTGGGIFLNYVNREGKIKHVELDKKMITDVGFRDDGSVDKEYIKKRLTEVASLDFSVKPYYTFHQIRNLDSVLKWAKDKLSRSAAQEEAASGVAAPAEVSAAPAETEKIELE